MEKAFDVAELGKMAKAKGLPDLEKIAKDEVEVILDWLSLSCGLKAASGEGIYALGVAAISAIKPAVLGELDKIDGQVG